MDKYKKRIFVLNINIKNLSPKNGLKKKRIIYNNKYKNL